MINEEALFGIYLYFEIRFIFIIGRSETHIPDAINHLQPGCACY